MANSPKTSAGTTSTTIARNAHKRLPLIAILGDFAGSDCVSTLGDLVNFGSRFCLICPAFDRRDVSLWLNNDVLLPVLLLPLCDIDHSVSIQSEDSLGLFSWTTNILKNATQFKPSYDSHTQSTEHTLLYFWGQVSLKEKRPWTCQGRSVCSQLFILNQMSDRFRTVCRSVWFCRPGSEPRHQTTPDCRSELHPEHPGSTCRFGGHSCRF